MTHKFVMFRKRVVRLLRKAKADYFIRVIGNAKVIWRQIKK